MSVLVAEGRTLEEVDDLVNKGILCLGVTLSHASRWRYKGCRGVDDEPAMRCCASVGLYARLPVHPRRPSVSTVHLPTFECTASAA